MRGSEPFSDQGPDVNCEHFASPAEPDWKISGSVGSRLGTVSKVNVSSKGVGKSGNGKVNRIGVFVATLWAC